MWAVDNKMLEKRSVKCGECTHTVSLKIIVCPFIGGKTRRQIYNYVFIYARFAWDEDRERESER